MQIIIGFKLLLAPHVQQYEASDPFTRRGSGLNYIQSFVLFIKTWSCSVVIIINLFLY